MTHRGRLRAWLAGALVLVLFGGIWVGVAPIWSGAHRRVFVAYFDNSNGIYPGDDIFILGVPVGKIQSIEPHPSHARIAFWVESKYQLPADVRAAIISPRLVSSRSIQLGPPYTGGPTLADNGTIPQNRTAVPVEWDDLRAQLQKLSDSLQPSTPGGVSPLGSFLHTAARNLDGQGAAIRATIMELSQAISALGDHSDDIFSTVKDLAALVSALQSSTDLMRELNQNFAAVTGLLANQDDEVGRAVSAVDGVTNDVRTFVADTKESVGTTVDRLSSVSSALVASLDDIKQTLHMAPNVLSNFTNIYFPAHDSATGILVFNEFANPISFLCGAIQAASRLGAEQASKLCVQYLAPIIKNRQYNFLPIGLNPIVGAMARPNELTYSEDWMRPDHRPAPPPPAAGDQPPLAAGPPPANAGLTDAGPAPSTPTDPAAGLRGLMAPTTGHP